MNQDSITAKRQWRSRLRDQRKQLYGGSASASSAAAIHPFATAIIEGVSQSVGRPIVVAGFSPVPGEAGVLKALRCAALAGHTVLLPTFAGEFLGWREWDGKETLQRSGGAKFGTEPTGRDHGYRALGDADLVFVPAVAVDKCGSRLGHGKGYYDRALAFSGPDTRVIAVIHTEEFLEEGLLPREAHDVPITEVLTESGLTGTNA